MQSSVVTCSKCKATLPTEVFNVPQFTPCPSCRKLIRVEVYPALFRPVSLPQAEQVILEGEAGCFYHPHKKAVTPCDGCGRFLCALCDVELAGQHLCTACLESGKKKGKLKSLETKHVRYDRIALGAATLPMLLCWTSLIGAPIALYIAIRYWKEPCSILGGSKASFITAIVLASLQIIGWAVFFAYQALK